MAGKRPASDGRNTFAARCTPSRMGTLICKSLTRSGLDADAARTSQTSATNVHKRTAFPNTVPQHDPANEANKHVRLPVYRFPDRSVQKKQLIYYVPSNRFFRQLRKESGNRTFRDSALSLRSRSP